MRILQIITLSELGGAQSVVVNLANSLSKEHEVIVAAGEGDGKMWKMLNANVQKVSVKHLKRSLSLISDVHTGLSLLKLYREYKPDIIHLHSSKIGVLGRLVFPKSKVVYTVHGFDSIRVAYRKYLPIERMLQTRCKAIVGVSSYDVHYLKEEKITHNVCLVYNGILKPVILESNPFNFCSQYKRKILCIARLSPQKNLELFLKVASLLPQYAFIWFGNQHEVVEVNLQNVFFMGNIPNAGAYTNYADLFILTSNYEGLPMVILEAMSYGKPVVASNVGGINEIVVNGENGYVVENVAEAFVEKIKYILEHDEVNKSFSEKAIQRFNEDLTVEKMVEGYMEIYKQ